MTNGRWIFRQIWYILGECQQFDSPCIDQYRLFVLVSRPILCFSGQGNFFLREWPISSVKTDCRTTLNHCPSISKQFVISVVCRSTLRQLEFSQLGVGRLAPIDDWKSTESRLVYRAILTNRLMEDRPYIDYARQMSFIVVKRRQGGRCHSSDFFVNKLKEFECPRSIKKIAAQHSVIKQRIAIF